MAAPELFKSRSIAELSRSLAQFMPGGKLFISKFIKDTVFNRLLNGLSVELQRAQDNLKIFSEGIIPATDQNFTFIDEWERVVGIPDDCFSGTGPDPDRRNAVVAKLATTGVQTAEDFSLLAQVFGIGVVVEPQSDFQSGVDARYIIRVSGPNIISDFPPYDIPYTLTTEQAFLECLFNTVKPANCEFLFVNT